MPKKQNKTSGGHPAMRTSLPPSLLRGNAAISPMAYTDLGSTPLPEAAKVASTLMPPGNFSGVESRESKGAVGAPAPGAKSRAARAKHLLIHVVFV